MASRKAEALAVVARARRVGWPVEQMDEGAWRITCPDKSRVQVHMTPSDRNHLATIARELNARGFDVAEAEASQREERERAEKLEADRQANERRTARTLERSSALARAAGPYAPAQVTISDLLANHPAPMIYHRVVITPAMAAALLERNSHNRKIRRADVIEYASALRTGRWRYTHQGVALDCNVVLQDGQQRLSAIVETGMAAEMMVSVGMDPANFAVVDTGRRRTAAQVLGLGGVKDASVAASVARLLYLHDVWGPSMLDHVSERVGNDLIADTFEKLDLDSLTRATRAAYRLRSETGQSPTGTAAGLYLIYQACGPSRDDLTHTFTEDLIHGATNDGDPVHTLRRQFTRASVAGPRHKIAAPVAMALVVKAWNLRLSGGSRAIVRTGSAMPSPIVPPDVGGEP